MKYRGVGAFWCFDNAYHKIRPGVKLIFSIFDATQDNIDQEVDIQKVPIE